MKKAKLFKALPLFILSMILVSVVALNVSAGTNKVSYQFRGASSQRSPIGKSNTSASIIIDCDYTTDRNGIIYGAVLADGDPNTPYKDTKISMEWWTDHSVISTRKANIIMYEGRMGWPFSYTGRDVQFALTSRTYTANNTHKQLNGHWTFVNSNVDNGIYSRFAATFSNWQTN